MKIVLSKHEFGSYHMLNINIQKTLKFYFIFKVINDRSSACMPLFVVTMAQLPVAWFTCFDLLLREFLIPMDLDVK
jgi:hypothetical protein